MYHACICACTHVNLHTHTHVMVKISYSYCITYHQQNPLKFGFIRIEVNTYQGWSHDSSSGQVEFVPSLSDLDFSIEAIEIFSHGYFDTELEGLMAWLVYAFQYLNCMVKLDNK